MGGISVEDGSPIDALVFFILIGLGIAVISRRGVTLDSLIRNNGWLSVYLIYCFAAILWSDFPFVALKRWMKDLGNPIMVLVLFVEPDFREAFCNLLKRCSYIVMPISILFIKYYPEEGRAFDEWSGMALNTGITRNKNALGWDLLILGFFFVWYTLQTFKQDKGKARRNELILCAGFLYMTCWLLSVANSKTPTVCLFVGIAILFFSGIKRLDKRYVGACVVALALAYFAADSVFDLYSTVLEFLGRDKTLTERTVVWAALQKVPINPILGTGYDSFWLGPRRESVQAALGWAATEAHNGYLQTYLDLGIVGLLLIFALLIAAYRKAGRALLNDYEFGRFRIAFVFIVVLYNWTEAALWRGHPVWIIFLLTAMDYPLHDKQDMHSAFRLTAGRTRPIHLQPAGPEPVSFHRVCNV
jgi:O-antigen ligase